MRAAFGALTRPRQAPPDTLLPLYQLTPPYICAEPLPAYDWSEPMQFGTVLALRVCDDAWQPRRSVVASIRRAYPVPPLVVWIDTPMPWLHALQLTHALGAHDVHAVRFDGIAARDALRVTLTDTVSVRESVARWLRRRGVRVGSEWPHVERALHAALMLQADPDMLLWDVAEELGYRNDAHVRDEITRVFHVTPEVAREILGWEWLLDHWLTHL